MRGTHGDRCILSAAGLTLVGDDHDGGRVLDDVPDPALGPVGGQGHVGEAGLEQGQQGHDQILGGEEPESSACYLPRTRYPLLQGHFWILSNSNHL